MTRFHGVVRELAGVMAHEQMTTVNPLPGGGVRGLFSTHPAAEERIRWLLGMA